MSKPGDVTLRRATPADDEFLCAVYGSTREEELAQVPWTAAQRAQFVRFQFDAQQGHYQSEYPAAQVQVVFWNGVAAGRLYVDRRAQEIRILDLTLLPAFQRKGIGTKLLGELLAEAAQTGKSLSIHLDGFSHAQSFFTRLGFEPGPTTGFHTLYVWQSVTSADKSPATTAEAG